MYIRKAHFVIRKDLLADKRIIIIRYTVLLAKREYRSRAPEEKKI